MKFVNANQLTCEYGIFFLREITEIKKQSEGARYFMQVGTLMERGSRKWKEKNAEIENGMFWAVGNRLLGLFLARARGGVYEAKDVVVWCASAGCRLRPRFPRALHRHWLPAPAGARLCETDT